MIETVDQNVVSSVKEGQDTRTLELNIFTGLVLENWLIQNGFGASFTKYIDPNYSFGNKGLEDDIKLYIKENIYERYYVADVNFYERVMKKGENLPAFNWELDDQGKLSAGYVQSKDFSVTNFSTESLDFALSYSVPVTKRTSIALSIILRKK
jgi:hypothetical protein